MKNNLPKVSSCLVHNYDILLPVTAIMNISEISCPSALFSAAVYVQKNKFKFADGPASATCLLTGAGFPQIHKPKI
jgi:hypothetical protein